MHRVRCLVGDRVPGDTLHGFQHGFRRLPGALCQKLQPVVGGELFLQRRRRVAGHEFPLADNQNLIAYRLDLREDMGAENHGMFLGKCVDQLADLNHLPGIETHGGFVQNDDLWKTENGLSQAHPLAKALGEVADQPAGLIFQMGHGYGLTNLVFPFRLWNLLQLRAEL
ncbi:hypothetical protein SDC9_149411 [bioreactor metagenome]|uniref:Uncharacterized protein n=1 Tax=bioreactor metagenome TaxID=1076179 RepID=A0A645EK99_9ZZZZ